MNKKIGQQMAVLHRIDLIEWMHFYHEQNAIKVKPNRLKKNSMENVINKIGIAETEEEKKITNN